MKGIIYVVIPYRCVCQLTGWVTKSSLLQYIVTIHLDHTGELISHPYEIATVFLPYGWFSESSSVRDYHGICVCQPSVLLSHPGELTVVHLCPTDEWVSHLCEITTARITYEWLCRSSVEHSNNISMSYVWLNKSFVYHSDIVCVIQMS